MDVEPGPPACPFDYMEIFDGNSTALMGGNRLCGRNTPPKLLSKANSVKIKFHSDNSDVGAGVAIEYKIKNISKKKIFHCDFNNGWGGMKFGKDDRDKESEKYLSLASGNFSICFSFILYIFFTFILVIFSIFQIVILRS